MKATKTERAEIAQVIARLRSQGLKVSTMAGHDPVHDRVDVMVEIPGGIGGVVFSHLLQATLPIPSANQTRASWALAKHAGYMRIWGRREAAAWRLRRYVLAVEEVQNFDTDSTISRQHYVDTGRFLTPQQVAEVSE